ncbi:hypothetical protein EXIGLDRAFT_681208 [Exidia glandulosa HHB12029]|uniref:MYND-type domain-containing protein n=1 Tax=Exidia glandulosa HHB12029 TaxID=1314781 RepID=A0A165E7F4_EXIGL|nr:hypothetical protein EXIGLDRAFT_681208 [Exidia glandulosa HHB12029]
MAGFEIPQAAVDLALQYHAIVRRNDCDFEGCPNEGKMRCSGCTRVFYCGVECQKKAWKQHKKTCKMHHDKDKLEEAHPHLLRRQPKVECSGCGVVLLEGARSTADDVCHDCGYTVCKPCGKSKTKGSCLCENSNFGTEYCVWEPRMHHVCGANGELYNGDYHPVIAYTDFPRERYPDMYESAPRRCNNCGKNKWCMTPETVTMCRNLMYQPVPASEANTCILA